MGHCGSSYLSAKTRHSSVSCGNTQVRQCFFIPETQIPSHLCKVWSAEFRVRGRPLPSVCDHGTAPASAPVLQVMGHTNSRAHWLWAINSKWQQKGWLQPMNLISDLFLDRKIIVACSQRSGAEDKERGNWQCGMTWLFFSSLDVFFIYEDDASSNKTPTGSCLPVTLTFLPLVSTCPHMFPQQQFLHKPQFVLVSMEANSKWLIITVWVKGGIMCTLCCLADRNSEKELSDPVRISTIMGNDSWCQLLHQGQLNGKCWVHELKDLMVQTSCQIRMTTYHPVLHLKSRNGESVKFPNSGTTPTGSWLTFSFQSH